MKKKGNDMKLNKYIVVLIAAVFSSCAMTHKESDMSALIINVLPANYYEDCHIKDSISVPYDNLSQYAKDLEKNQKIVIYCAHAACALSHRAWHLLHDMGFTDVYAYEGGIAEWKKSGLPSEGPCTLIDCNANYEKQESDGIMKEISKDDLLKLIK